MTFANFASSLFPQVYQPSRSPLNARELSLVAPFCVSRLFALGHHFLPQDLVIRHLTATAVSLTPPTYILAWSRCQRSAHVAPLHSPSVPRLEPVLASLQILLSNLHSIYIGAPAIRPFHHDQNAE
jgi:hypothetical protein